MVSAEVQVMSGGRPCLGDGKRDREQSSGVTEVFPPRQGVLGIRKGSWEGRTGGEGASGASQCWGGRSGQGSTAVPPSVERRVPAAWVEWRSQRLHALLLIGLGEYSSPDRTSKHLCRVQDFSGSCIHMQGRFESGLRE